MIVKNREVEYEVNGNSLKGKNKTKKGYTITINFSDDKKDNSKAEEAVSEFLKREVF